MILRRDPQNVALLALAALAWLAGVCVCIMGAMYWRYTRAEFWTWISIIVAGHVMILTWWLIYMAGQEYHRPDAQPEGEKAEPPKPRILPRLPPDGYEARVNAPAINWPDIPRHKLHRALQVALKVGRVSVRVMREAKLNEQEAGIFREWIRLNGWGSDERGAMRINDTGRGELEALLPFARDWRL